MPTQTSLVVERNAAIAEREAALEDLASVHAAFSAVPARTSSDELAGLAQQLADANSTIEVVSRLRDDALDQLRASDEQVVKLTAQLAVKEAELGRAKCSLADSALRLRNQASQHSLWTSCQEPQLLPSFLH